MGSILSEGSSKLHVPVCSDNGNSRSEFVGVLLEYRLLRPRFRRFLKHTLFTNTLIKPPSILAEICTDYSK